MTTEKEQGELRSLVEDCMRKCANQSAVFYADKLVSLTNFENVNDIYLLAICYFQLKQFKRVVSFLQKVFLFYL